MTTELNAIAFKAQTHRKHRFQNLYGQLTAKSLFQGWLNLNKSSAAGIDGMTSSVYETQLVDNIRHLAAQLANKQYRVSDVKRVYIPKANGKQRPLGLPTLEDKIVQQSVSDILQSLWEPEFKRFSYGYRPNKSAHQAVHSLQMNLQYGSYGYVVEADIKGFFDNMNHAWLLEMLSQKVEDKALLNLINQWLKARVVEPNGKKRKSQAGTPQGGVISPILANIYLHYALDLWFEKQIKPRLQGHAMLIRYADDFVVAFQYKDEAKMFYRALSPRLNKFNLELAADKTSIKRFSRFQVSQASHFEFLGFRLYWEADFKGEARVRRETSPKKHRVALSTFYQWIKVNRHKRLNNLIPALNRKVQGFRNYFALSGNSRSINNIFDRILKSLLKWLNRRSQRKSFTWKGMKSMLKHFGFQSMRVRKPRVVVDWYDDRAYVLHGQ